MSEKKTLWLTGCSRGLGRALVDGFLADGWQVAGCARNLEGLPEHEQAFFQAVDVCDEAAVRQFCEGAREKFGAPSLLVNNAATINTNAPLWEVPAEDFDRTIDVNLKGIANVIRVAFPMMLEKGEGIVVNLSSGWGRSVSPEVAPYCCTKFGVEGLSKAMAEEVQPGFAVVPLNPGIINTDMLRKTMEGSASGFPSTKEWARLAVPFLQKLSAKDNGQSLTVS